MYSVSNDYRTAIHRAVQKGYINGLIDGHRFTDEDVLLGSASWSNQCADSSDVKLGAVYIGTFKATFINQSLVNRGTWEGRRITVFWDQLVDDTVTPHVYETIPIGEFIVASANHSAEGVTVTAYDYMSKFDKPLNFTQISGSPFNIAKKIANDCSVLMAQIKTEIEALPNGTETLSLYYTNDCKTYRDLLSWLAQTLGCFATIDRFGHLVFKGWGGTVVDSFSAADRFTGGKYSDFSSFFTAIRVTDIETQASVVEAMEVNNGLTMNLGANPFLQYGLTEVKVRMRRAILNSLSGKSYVPHTTTMLANPCYDLGDTFNFNGGIAGGVQGVNMSFTYTFNRSFKMQGFGANPNLFGAQSKTDKNIAGLANKTDGLENKFEVYTNAEVIEYEIEGGSNNHLMHLCTVNFACNRDSVVEVNTRITCQWKVRNSNATDGQWETIKNQLLYVLDNSTQNPTMSNAFDAAQYNALYRHDENIPVADQQRYDFYTPILNVEGGVTHTLDFYWRFVRTLRGLYQYVNKGAIMITLRGQGLVVEQPWDGYIIVDDSTPVTPIGGINVDDLDETTEVTLIIPLVLDQIEDEVDPLDLGILGVEEMEDEAEVTLVRPKRNIISIRNGNLVTIDKDDNITTI